MATVVRFLLSILSAAAWAFAFHKAWAWFPAPLFHLPLISWGHAYGIMLTLGIIMAPSHLVLMRGQSASNDTIARITESAASLLAAPLMLAMAFLAHLLFPVT